MNQLAALRKEFQSTYHANVESLGKTRKACGTEYAQ